MIYKSHYNLFFSFLILRAPSPVHFTSVSLCGNNRTRVLRVSVDVFDHNSLMPVSGMLRELTPLVYISCFLCNKLSVGLSRVFLGYSDVINPTNENLITQNRYCDEYKTFASNTIN